MGINQGMLPIAGYNYGAQKYDRLMKVLKYSIIAATIITTSGFAISQLFPYECARLFTNDKELINLSIRAIKINMIAFPVIGYQMVITNFFQSIGKAGMSIFLSLSRQMLFLLPLLIILPPVLGVDGVWIALPVSDVIAAIVAAIIMTVYMKKLGKTVS